MLAKRSLASFWAAALLACGPGTGGTDRIADGQSPLRDVRRLGKLSDAKLIELSGLTRSIVHPGLFWGINDSGNDPEIFAIDSTGKALARVLITGATNMDWEAIASGPCDEGSCLFVGDVGDNQERRGRVTVWRVVEPSLSATHSSLAAKADVRYPGGARDVEAMWVSGDRSIWLLTKRPARAANGTLRRAFLYRVPGDLWNVSGVAHAELTDSLSIVPLPRASQTWITDAALLPADGESRPKLAVRTYGSVYIFAVDENTGRPGSLLSTCSLSELRSNAGEAVTWLSQGSMLFGSEGRFIDLFTGRCD